MDGYREISLKKVCCTCLSINRKLIQLCKIFDGINNLYNLLSYDTEAYREGFFKDLTELSMCWECLAVMNRLCKFKAQACEAQKQLSQVIDGRISIKSINTSLSKLSYCYKNYYDHIYNDDLIDNFIDCGPDDFIKSESDSDIPLSEFQIRDRDRNMNDSDSKARTDTDKRKVKAKKKKEKNGEDKLFSTNTMTEYEMIESIKRRKLVDSYVKASSKCESCIESFKDDIELEKHKLESHKQKAKHSPCDICLVYHHQSTLASHRKSHYMRYSCTLCGVIFYSVTNVLNHLEEAHAVEESQLARWKKTEKIVRVKNPGSKPRRNPAMMDKRTPFGFSCTSCNQYFETKNQRYKHVQKYHREGFKCSTCGKRFAFRNNLTRHERVHGPHAREQCSVCGKLVRCDLARAHAVTHEPRAALACSACNKRFVSRASYRHHLRYASAHATHDVLKYKCSECPKGYRSRGELRDHINYQHMGKTQHKCPICEKALATRRCITRHVRRAHKGLKENARDKICHTCGKAFRDAKGLREHEAIHSGARPLSCGECGRAFRQAAALSAHRKRRHNVQTAARPAYCPPA